MDWQCKRVFLICSVSYKCICIVLSLEEEVFWRVGKGVILSLSNRLLIYFIPFDRQDVKDIESMM